MGMTILPSHILNTLLERTKQGQTPCFTPQDWQAWAGQTFAQDAWNAVALILARKFLSGEVTFEEADWIINDFWLLVHTGRVEVDTQAYAQPWAEVFFAFDAGEYHHKPDKSDDPVRDRTVPMLKKVLAGAA